MLHVTGPFFGCGVTIRHGRVDLLGTAPYLRRLKGMAVEVFLEQARAKGWKVQRLKCGR